MYLYVIIYIESDIKVIVLECRSESIHVIEEIFRCICQNILLTWTKKYGSFI